jgi:L-aspartate oxidase
MRAECDYLVLGSGVAGLSFALEAARHSQVMMVTKRGSADSATNWAQGGIAAVLDPSDSFEAHVNDTIGTGGGLSHREIVEMVVRDGPGRIKELMDLGAQFTRSEEGLSLDLTREGGHSARRVVHAGDITGEEVQRVLLQAAAASPRIEIMEDHMAIDLVEASKFGGARQVVGAYVLDEKTGAVKTYLARATVLATGGAGKVYLYTSNPDVATGDGIAMAYRAGAELANMEFFQFHPTCLFNPEAKSFLISEALRGEGGVLRLRSGEAFMKSHHEMKDLAFIMERFPNIHERCLQFGIDMTKDPIPVVPAAHYMCGGVVVDEDGSSTLPGLWAVGEVTCTGLHGANRLASNSLLEGLVYGHRTAIAARASLDTMPRVEPAKVPDWDVGEAVPSDEAVVVSQNWDEIRRFMWNYVGIVRTDRRLRRASRRIAMLQDEIREYYWAHLVNRDMLELRNIADVAELIIRCAGARKESRGLHYNLDYPHAGDEWQGDTRISRNVPPHITHE